MKCKLFIIFLCGIVEILGDCSNKAPSTRSKLQTNILCGYDKGVRPTVDEKNATKVIVKLILKHLDYDMHERMLSVNGWLLLLWKDNSLKWDPKEYDDIKYIHISSDLVWFPDLSIYNRVDQSGSPEIFDTIKCTLYSHGTIVCVVPTKTDAICKPNLTNYPFDLQNCTIRYGSWVHSGEEIDYKFGSPAVSVEDYDDNGEWKLIKVNEEKHEGKFKCCPNSTYPSFLYSFELTRHSGTQVCLVLIPSLVMLVMTMATLSIDIEDGQRIALICCNILSHILYMQYLSWQLPVTGPEPALLVIYERDSLFMVTFILLLTIIERKLIKIKSSSPLWISSSIGTIMGLRSLQHIFIFDENFKNLANRVGDDDGAQIIENAESGKNNDWLILARMLDNLCFFIYLIIYIVMFIRFIP